MENQSSSGAGNRQSSGSGRKSAKAGRRRRRNSFQASNASASSGKTARISAEKPGIEKASADQPGDASHRQHEKNQGTASRKSPQRKSLESSRPRRAFAAIDLGTNNCRLLIARPAGDSFMVVDAFSRVVRLGEGLATTNRLSQEAMDRALAALSVCADKLRKRNVYLARSVATEACRRAENGAEFIEMVKRETGLVLDVISAEEEARLAVLGCHILLEPGNGPSVIFDIGGGSTELVLVDNDSAVPRIIDWESIPWGVVSLTEVARNGAAETGDLFGSYMHMRRRIAEALSTFESRIESHVPASPRLLGSSGTVTTLAGIHLKLKSYDRNRIDGLIVPSSAMRDVCQDLARLDIHERREIPCVGRERADLVVAGCAILEGIMDIWPAERLGIADRGIREGILRALMAASQPVHTPCAGKHARTGEPG